ncbi:MAG: putative DNA binding domain-containing protein [Dehalococcoidia bacterium]|nr:putative DNA binding domain-containing protein [Dehalococcoidia bacterium]
MTQEELLALIKQGEGQQLEFKESLKETKQAIEALCAFVHAVGGTVLIGVTNDGHICGVQLGKKGIEVFANTIRQNTKPPLAPFLFQVESGGNTVLAAQIVPDMHNTLYQSYGKSFIRMGKTTQVMSPEEIQSRLLGSPVESLLKQKGVVFEARSDGPNRFACDVAATLRKAFSIPAEWGVKLKGVPDGSFDVIALSGSRLCYIECIEDMSEVIDKELEAFLRRVNILGADMAIYLVSTDEDLAPLVSKLGTLFQANSTRMDRAKPAELACLVSASHAGYLFVSNTKPTVATKLRSCFWYMGKPVSTTQFPPLI